MDLFVVEDAGFRNFLPLTWTRPVYDLKCGMTSLLDKIERAYGLTASGLGCRDYLAQLVAEQHPQSAVNRVAGDSALIVNGRVLWNGELAALIPLAGPDRLYKCGETVVAARLSGGNLKGMDWRTPIRSGSFPELETEEVSAQVFDWPWDLVHHNAEAITNDFAELAQGGAIEGQVSPGAYLEGQGNLCIAAGARIAPGVVLDASSGPIYIAPDVKVMPQATIVGPAYIGPGSTIKIGAKIYAGTAIGAACKMGGEVEGSIIHGHSNKQHDGFLGHSYLGQWVNFGAGTDNSDLKNDYGNVHVTVGDETIDSGSMFVGSIIGDHTKTGIHTMLNTGTVAGVGCNLFGAGFPPKYIPSFVWGGVEGFSEYRLDKFLQVARTVMERRSIDLSAAQETVLRHVYAETSEERAKVVNA
ncbi:MAG: GlmU family protein [Candidatus Neomarinimicrobiota bacterium]